MELSTNLIQNEYNNMYSLDYLAELSTEWVFQVNQFLATIYKFRGKFVESGDRNNI